MGVKERDLEMVKLLFHSKISRHGRWPDGNLVINQKQAVTIKRIYSMFLQGMTYHAIANQLSEEEIEEAFVSAADQLLSCKDSVIEDAQDMIALLFDTAELERQQNELLEETQLISDMVQATIKENATTALDQQEYQKRYDSLPVSLRSPKLNLKRSCQTWKQCSNRKLRLKPSSSNSKVHRMFLRNLTLMSGTA